MSDASCARRNEPEAFYRVGAVLPSVVLQDLYDAAPEGRVTVGWALRKLDRQSFGLILLLLAVVGAVPGVCTIAGVLLVICASQMIVGRPTPYFPRWIADRSLPGRHLRASLPRLVAILRAAERALRPRWLKPGATTRCFIGIVVTALSIRLLVVPVPFSNVLPAVIIAVISLAYLEEDGVFLSFGLFAGSIMIVVDTAIAVELIRHRLGH